VSGEAGNIQGRIEKRPQQEILPWSDQTLGTMKVTDYHLGHRSRVLRLGHARSAEFLGGVLENVGTATATADAADDA
jgi:hypothetical protein